MKALTPLILALALAALPAVAQAQVADLEITKDDGGVSVSAGGTIVYTLGYRNLGPGGAADVALSDLVPPQTRFDAAASSAGWSCLPDGAAGSECRYLLGDLQPGAEGSVTVGFRLDPAVAGVITNTAAIGATTTDPDPANNSDTEETQVVGPGGAPDLAASKADGGAVAEAGEVVAYTLTYQNLGNQGATGVTLTETVPEHTTFEAASSTAGWSCAGGGGAGSVCTLDVGGLAGGGASGTAVFAVRVDDPLGAGVSLLTNTATIGDDGTNGADQDPSNNTAFDDTPIGAGTAPDYLLMKDDGGASANAGEVVAYTLTYANAGNQGGTGVTLTETVPEHASFEPSASTAGWSCSPDATAGSVCTLDVGSLAGGGDGGTATFAVRVEDPVAAGVTSILNTATIGDDGANGADPNPGNNDATDATPIGADGGTAPDLSITKADGGQLAKPEETIVYTLGYANLGNQGASGVTITETVPLHTTFDAGASDAGWSCSTGGSAGSQCSYLAGTVMGGESGTVAFAVTVDPTLPAGVEVIDNVASIADDGAGGADLDPTNNTATEMTALGSSAAPDLSITLGDGDVTADAGDTVFYTVDFRNDGTRGASGVAVTVLLPSAVAVDLGASDAGWSCSGVSCQWTAGVLASGANGSAILAVTVAEPLPAGVEELVASATVNDDGTNGADLDPANNTDEETTPVGSGDGGSGTAPDLSITKDDGEVVAEAGEVVIYTLGYANLGNQGASGVVITETVPEHTAFAASSSTAGWVCDPGPAAGSVCTLELAEVAGGGAGGTALFAVRVDDPVPVGVAEIRNTASIADDGASGADQDPADNQASETTPVELTSVDLELAMIDDSATVDAGDTIRFTFTFGNTGERISTGVELRMNVPAFTRAETAVSSPGWSCPPVGGPGSFCTLPVGTLPAGASGTAELAITVDDPLPAGVDRLVHEANVTDDGKSGPDADPTNNEVRDDTAVGTGPDGVGTAPDLSLFLEDGGEPVAPGEVISYSLSFLNHGNQAAQRVTVEQTIPEHTTFEPSLSTPGWSCGPILTGGGQCRFSLEYLAAGGESITVIFAVRLDDPLPAAVSEIRNRAEVFDDGRNGPDQDPSDNTASVVTTVGCEKADCYYEPVDPSDPATLRRTLHDLVDDHRRVARGSAESWIALEVAQEDPADDGRVVDLLGNRSFPAAGGPGGGYLPFHPWPGLSAGDPAASYPRADLHAVFLAEEGYVRRVEGAVLGRCDLGCRELPTGERAGRGGGRDLYPGWSSWLGKVDDGQGDGKVFEPWRDRRGDLARALLYLDLRYAGGHHADGTPEAELVLRDPSAFEIGRNSSTSVDLRTLLHWHRQDPVDARERWRNEVIHTVQGNRNPFVDHPEWAHCLFDGRCEEVAP